jgi:hypothetical protein
MIVKEPAVRFPSKYSPKPIDNERIKKMDAVSKPPETSDFWKNILAGGFGTDDAHSLRLNNDLIGLLCCGSFRLS